MRITEFVNQPTVKQGIKNIVGFGTCVIGVKALCDLYENKAPDQVALKCAQVSFILSAMVTPLGVWGISLVVNRLFTNAQLEKVFGPNTIFAVNWTHPRHIASLASTALVIPFIAKRLFVSKTDKEDITAELCAYWVLLTGRPVLHVGNQLLQTLFK